MIMRHLIAITLLASAVLSGCAGINETNRKFADVNARINALEAKSAADLGALDSKIGTLDAKHNSDLSALDAKHDADTSKLDKNIQEALDRANSANKLAEGKFVYSTVLNGDSINFSSGRTVLSKEAEAYLADLAHKLIADNQNVYLEIQGHTDATGTDALNVSLGLRRAEAVRLFLNQQGIALNRISTISYGKTVPVESNKTTNGRAANRRVVIVVLK
jgi:outer membrane protein OmpA-like peptidoglycan-associated protein